MTKRDRPSQAEFPFVGAMLNLPALDSSPVNEYGETVTASVLRKPDSGRIVYRCKDELWGPTFKAWQKAPNGVPEPMPSGHLMFKRPAHYGYVPADWEGERLRLATRRAIRCDIVGQLSGGWDRELRETPEGMRTLARIVRATVDARTRGESVGTAHFFACIATSI